MYIVYYSNHNLFKVSGHLSFARVHNTEDRSENGMFPRDQEQKVFIHWQQMTFDRPTCRGWCYTLEMDLKKHKQNLK